MPADHAWLFDAAPIVPIIQAEHPHVAVATARALMAGGLPVVEVVLRTERSLECLHSIVNEVPDMVVGAGTVINAAQAEQALQSGAEFIVSPGIDEGVVETASTRGVPVFPGVMTPTEAQRAYNLGLRVVKFFPSSVAGGGAAIKALASVFRDLRFLPTGGVNADNLADYLRLPAVIGCGGSWLTPASAIESGDFARVTQLAAEAVEIAKGATA